MTHSNIIEKDNNDIVLIKVGSRDWGQCTIQLNAFPIDAFSVASTARQIAGIAGRSG